MDEKIKDAEEESSGKKPVKTSWIWLYLVILMMIGVPLCMVIFKDCFMR